ncbi:MAG TPA: hypothetical protein PLO37_02065 [Candidatus Hydrogenedentes bacterium]|nr:hypothetical protein [Candidatus Hydrogenedentota bacterium]HPG65603.1 hypothetical protein [Candidatus Hydrogenedentota bacterium]
MHIKAVSQIRRPAPAADIAQILSTLVEVLTILGTVLSAISSIQGLAKE